ncbi:hypothetical protein ACOSQ2_007135 [Xanthoceras sorbifolium]
MESGGKERCSETSSEENDHRLEQVKEDTAATTKRSYECTFCKRGFTNAQALGGHMNIHRKDRAKNKKVTGSSFSSKHMTGMNEEYMNPRFMATISSEQAEYYQIPEAQRNYFTYYQPSVSSPINPHAYQYGSDFIQPRSQYSLTTNDQERILGANLRLGNSSKCAEDKEDEVDLELRLGHNP